MLHGSKRQIFFRFFWKYTLLGISHTMKSQYFTFIVIIFISGFMKSKIFPFNFLR